MQQYWKSTIEKHGGKVENHVIGNVLDSVYTPSVLCHLVDLCWICLSNLLAAGVTCLVVSPTERERGGSSKVVEAVLVITVLFICC